MSNGRTDESELIRMEAVMAKTSYYPNNCIEGLRKTSQILRQD
jgi:hypothetical protein